MAILNLKDQLFEFIEVCEAKQAVDRVVVHFCILGKISSKILIKGFDLVARKTLDQFRVDGLLEDLHILLEDDLIL